MLKIELHPSSRRRIVAVTGEEAQAAIALADQLAAQVCSNWALCGCLDCSMWGDDCAPTVHLPTPSLAGVHSPVQVEAADKLPVEELSSAVKALTQTVSSERAALCCAVLCCAAALCCPAAASCTSFRAC